MSEEDIKRLRKMAEGLRIDAKATDNVGYGEDAAAIDRLLAVLAALAPKLTELQAKYDCNTVIMHGRTTAMNEYMKRAEKAEARLAAFEPVVAALRYAQVHNHTCDGCTSSSWYASACYVRQEISACYVCQEIAKGLEAYERAASLDKGSGGRG